MAVEVDKEEKSSVKRPVAEEDNPASSSCGGNGKRGLSGKGAKGNANASTNNNYDEEEMNVEPELRTLNKTKHNWRSNKQYALTKVAAHKDKASLVVCHWLFKRYTIKEDCLTPPEKDTLWEFSTASFVYLSPLDQKKSHLVQKPTLSWVLYLFLHTKSVMPAQLMNFQRTTVHHEKKFFTMCHRPWHWRD
jgi:hypothetical protein